MNKAPPQVLEGLESEEQNIECDGIDDGEFCGDVEVDDIESLHATIDSRRGKVVCLKVA